MGHSRSSPAARAYANPSLFSPRFCLSCLLSPETSAVENGNCPGPSRRCALDLHRKARHHESGRRQLLEIMQLLDVAIADMAAGLVAFPDQAGILGLRIFLGGVDERRVP